MIRSDTHGRWITSREALLFQGFPIRPSMSFGKALCTWASEPDSDDENGWKSVERDTDRTARIGQAGNCMHTQCIGIVLLHVISSGNMSLAALDDIGMRGHFVRTSQMRAAAAPAWQVEVQPPMQPHADATAVPLIVADSETPQEKGSDARAHTSSVKSNKSSESRLAAAQGPTGLSPCLRTMGFMIAKR